MNSKKKGNKTERVAAAFMKDWSNWEFSRVPQSGGLRWKAADNIAGDILCTEPNKLFYFSIEVKGYNKIDFSHLLYDTKSDIDKFWQQATDDSIRAHKIPLLLMRYNGLPAGFFFVAMDKNFARHCFKKLPFERYMYTKNLFITTTAELAEFDFKTFNKAGKKWLSARATGQ
jgi:hypothetical protein